MDPQRDGVDGYPGGTVAVVAVERLDRRAPIRPHPSDSATERAHDKPLREPRESVHCNTVAPEHPDRAGGEPGVLDVRVGDVLEPAGEGVEPDPPGGGAVGQAGPHRERVFAGALGGRDELVHWLTTGMGAGSANSAAVRCADFAAQLVVVTSPSRVTARPSATTIHQPGCVPVAKSAAAPLAATAPRMATPRVVPTWRLVDATAAATPA